MRDRFCWELLGLAVETRRRGKQGVSILTTDDGHVDKCSAVDNDVFGVVERPNWCRVSGRV